MPKTPFEIAKLFRMEDTERLRSRMRERRRREVFEKAEKEEEREKAVFARFVFCFTSYHCLFLFLRNLKKKKSVFCEVFLFWTCSLLFHDYFTNDWTSVS